MNIPKLTAGWRRTPNGVRKSLAASFTTGFPKSKHRRAEEVTVPNNAIAKISESPASKLREAAISKWLVKFCALFDKNLTPILKATWCEALSDLNVETINTACLQAERTAEFFPSPGFIRKQISQADARGFELNAEREWQSLMAWVRENIFPDTGIRRGAPELPAGTQYAARAAGGVFYLERCDEDRLVWARKNFLATLTNVHETRQVEHLLSDESAKRILRELCAGPHSVRSAQALPPSSVDQPRIVEVREFLENVNTETPKPDAAESKEVLEKKWRGQKDRLAPRCTELGPCENSRLHVRGKIPAHTESGVAK
jgi:hypothetical protein